MKTASIQRASMDAIVAQAEREFPFECCGFIIGDNETRSRKCGRSPTSRTRCTPKIAAAFPRDARTAFLMEPKEHLAVMNEVDRRKLAIRVVYHSHPDHDAYFSATDRAQACSFDPSEPDYPDTVYIVLSIRAGKFARAAAFAWDSEKKEFAETAANDQLSRASNESLKLRVKGRLDFRKSLLILGFRAKTFHVKRF